MPRPKCTRRATAMPRRPPSARCCCARSITASGTACRSSRRCCTCRPIRIRAEDVKAALTNAMGRAAAVAQVHGRLYTSHALKSVLLNQYLEALREDLRRSAEGNRMSRLTLGRAGRDRSDRAVAIEDIVNELVENARQIAYPDGAGHDPASNCRPTAMTTSCRWPTTASVSMCETDPRLTGMGQRIVSAMARSSTLMPNAILPMPGTSIMFAVSAARDVAGRKPTSAAAV